jgi:hypothetical protein
METKRPTNTEEWLILISNEQNSMQELIKEIHTKVKVMPDNVYCHDKHEHVERVQETQDKRLTKLENWRWYIMGGIITLVTVGGIIVEILHK